MPSEGMSKCGSHSIELLWSLAIQALLAHLWILCAATSAHAGTESLSISPVGYRIESVVQMAPGTFDLVARAAIANSGPLASNVTAQLSSTTAGAIVIDGDVRFGNVSTTAPSKPVRSIDTFRLRLILPNPISWQAALQYAQATLGGLAWRIGCDGCGNRPPVADAGPDRTVALHEINTLDGSHSTDPDGNPLTFSWTIVSAPAGSNAQLSNANAMRPTFAADVAGAYALQLIVNDGTVNSTPSIVMLTTTNSAPVANAGPDQSTYVGGTVRLDGAGSTDVDGDPLVYEWMLVEQPPASQSAIDAPDTAAPRASLFVDRPGRYVAQLTVRDAASTSAPDATVISTLNTRPQADAGPDVSARLGEMVQLSALASTDADGDPLTYRWSLTRPAGSTASLTSMTTASTTFVIDAHGEYLVQLIASDGTAESDADTVTVSTMNSAPVAIADPLVGPTRAGQRVSLDGHGSSDADGDALSFTWSIVAAPLESSAQIELAQSPYPSITPDVPGTYVVQLIVSDGHVDSAPTTVQFVADPAASDPPQISIDYPADGQYINDLYPALHGQLSRPASLTVNGEPTELYDSTRFTRTLQLTDGPNELTLVAHDDGGTSTLLWHLHVDREAPAAPDTSLIDVLPGAGDSVAVTGSAGSAEPGSQVYVENFTNGETTAVTADETGAFSLSIRAQLGDHLVVRQEDRAANLSESADLHPNPTALFLAIRSHADHTTVADRSIVLRGEISGTIDAAVSANDIPAAILGNGTVRQFSVVVPLLAGENTISVIAKTTGGDRAERLLHISCTGQSPFALEASTTEGAAPLDVTFDISRFTTTRIESIQMDFDGDGIFDATQGSRPEPQSHAYPTAGHYIARVEIVDAARERWNYEVPITVHAPTTLHERVMVTWNAFLAALSTSSTQSALAQMTPECAERYAPLLGQLQSSLEQIAESVTAPELTALYGSMAEYVVSRSTNGEHYSMLVYFHRGTDGVWRIANL